MKVLPPVKVLLLHDSEMDQELVRDECRQRGDEDRGKVLTLDCEEGK